MKIEIKVDNKYYNIDSIKPSLAKKIIDDLFLIMKINKDIPDNEFINNTLQLVSEICFISVEEIKGRKRDPKIVTARRIYCYFSKLYTKLSYKKIGALINIDHSTVMYHYHFVEERINGKYIDKELSSYIIDLEQKTSVI